MNLTVCSMLFAVPSNDDEFEKWQKEIREAEAEGGSLSRTFAGALEEGDNDRPSTPPEGEEEFTDDDGTTYKWDRSLRAWVPQVGSWIKSLSLNLFLLGLKERIILHEKISI